MKSCSACGYLKAPGEEVSFHVFPKKENIREMWMQAVGLENVPNRNSVLCSLHFSEECFYYPAGGTKQRKYLKPGSIPTIFGSRFSRKSNMQSKQLYVNCNKHIVNKNMENVCIKEDTNIDIDEIYANDTTICSKRKIHEIESENTCMEKNINTDLQFEEIYVNDTTTYTKMKIHKIKSEDTCIEKDINTDLQFEEIYANDTTTCSKRKIHEIESEDTYRKYPETPAPKWSRRQNPRYIGDCVLSDLDSPQKAKRNWKIAMSYIDTLRNKCTKLQTVNNRLKKKVTNLETLIKNFKSKHNAKIMLQKCYPFSVLAENIGTQLP